MLIAIAVSMVLSGLYSFFIFCERYYNGASIHDHSMCTKIILFIFYFLCGVLVCPFTTPLFIFPGSCIILFNLIEMQNEENE